ncbi:HAUS augmin-like complex subunit 5 [Caretta caretta]|uniref:HAUS augmin-like complex subunit 5 n=1 Tax=Caretta caretta TaxID=8467 RepID=UPI003F4B251B
MSCAFSSSCRKPAGGAVTHRGGATLGPVLGPAPEGGNSKLRLPAGPAPQQRQAPPPAPGGPCGSGRRARCSGPGMERGGPALELKLWAAQEMGLPPGKVPPDGAFRRMCSGQCAEIWRYVTRHVHHQRNVKKIRGNLLWYQHLEEAEGKPSGSEPEQERRQQLAQGVARLRGELQQLDLQMETAQREVMADEVSLEAAQERIRDAQRRSLLLKAYAARLAKERQQLQGSVAQLRGRLEQLKDISRKAKVELTVGGKLPDLGFAGLEPEVLRDVRTACQLRFHFLKSLFEHSTSGAVPRTSEELLDASYQHWLSTVEDIVGSYPPNHVLAALEHLALENTLQMQELTSRIDIPRDVEALKFRYESSRLEDLAGPPAALPSVRGLIQEGWSRCEELWVQQLPLQAREQHCTAQLASLVQEMHRLVADGSEHAILASAKHSCTGRGAGSRWISHHFLQRLSRFPWRTAPLSGTQLSRARGMNRESAKRVKPALARKWLLASHLLVSSKAFPWSGLRFRASMYSEWMAAFRVLSSRPLALGVTMVLSSDLICGTRARSFPPPDPYRRAGKLPTPPPLPPACWVPAPSPLPPCRPSAEGPGKGGGTTARSLLRGGGGEELGMGSWGRGVESGQGAGSTPTTLAPAPSPLL